MVPEDKEHKEVTNTGNQLNFATAHVILNGTVIITMLELGKFTMLEQTKFGKQNGMLRMDKNQEAILLGN